MRPHLAAIVGVSFMLAVACGSRGHLRGLPTASTHVPTRGRMQAPADRALFVPHFFARSRLSPEIALTLVDAQGRAYCQLNPGSHCVLSLAPGRYRFYVVNSPMALDVIDAEVTAGRTYFAWIDFTNFGSGIIAEKLVPSTAPHGRVETIWASAETTLRMTETAALEAQLREHLDVMLRNGERRMHHMDARHVEAHTIHPGDGE